MRLQFFIIGAVFYIMSVLIFTVCLRSAGNRAYYRHYAVNAELSRTRQELWRNQLRLESLINPAAVAQRIERETKPRQ